MINETTQFCRACCENVAMNDPRAKGYCFDCCCEFGIDTGSTCLGVVAASRAELLARWQAARAAVAAQCVTADDVAFSRLVAEAHAAQRAWAAYAY